MLHSSRGGFHIRPFSNNDCVKMVCMTTYCLFFHCSVKYRCKSFGRIWNPPLQRHQIKFYTYNHNRKTLFCDRTPELYYTFDYFSSGFFGMGLPVFSFCRTHSERRYSICPLKDRKSSFAQAAICSYSFEDIRSGICFFISLIFNIDFRC